MMRGAAIDTRNVKPHLRSTYGFSSSNIAGPNPTWLLVTIPAVPGASYRVRRAVITNRFQLGFSTEGEPPHWEGVTLTRRVVGNAESMLTIGPAFEGTRWLHIYLSNMGEDSPLWIERIA